MEKLPSEGEKKIREYVLRIRAGESVDSIKQGLPPSFIRGIEAHLNDDNDQDETRTRVDIEDSKDELNVPPQYVGLPSDILENIWTIPRYVNNEKTRQEEEKKRQIIDALKRKESDEREIQKRNFVNETKINFVRKNLGINESKLVDVKEQEFSSSRENNLEKNYSISEMINYVSQGRKQAVVELYKNLENDIDNPDSKEALYKALIGDIYNKYRIAEYPMNINEEKTWEEALKSTNIETNNIKSEWLYRGTFPECGQETVTRGSFNVHVTPELISDLDKIILSGKIKANYKFGQPGTVASPTERHDSISIYFLEQPSDESLQELIQIVGPHVRGDNLLGKKIGEGFFLSEVGSIETSHVESFVEKLKLEDTALAEAVKNYTSPQPGRGTSLKMSEAQFYAIKDVARAAGFDITYQKDTGFEIKK